MSYEIQNLISRLLVIFALWLLFISLQLEFIGSSYLIIELTLTIITIIFYLNFKLTQEESANGFKTYLNEILFVFYMVLIYFFPRILIFMPIIVAEGNYEKTLDRYLALIIAIQAIFNLNNFLLFVSLALLSIVIYWFYNLLDYIHSFERRSYLQIDQLRNFNEQIQSEQDILLSLQDHRLEMSRNYERKRIVSEIHDILGHQISSSVIQIAALQYATDDPLLKEQLKAVENVLQEGMDNIREVIHKEHDDAFDLHEELEDIVNGFSKCPIQFHYDNKNRPSSRASHAISNSVREALTNINKHSNASQVDIHFQELADHWQLLIRDNGDNINKDIKPSGIGLMNMEERILRLNGTFHISTDNGFRIFMTIPKGGNLYESTAH